MSLELDKVDTLVNSSQFYKLKMIEVTEIRKHKNNNFNQDEGFEMSYTWIPVISKLKHKRNQANFRKEEEKKRESRRFKKVYYNLESRALPSVLSQMVFWNENETSASSLVYVFRRGLLLKTTILSSTHLCIARS